MRVCVRWLPSVMNADRASLTLLEGDYLVFQAVSDDGVLLKGQRLALKNSVTGEVARSRKAMIVHAPDTKGSRVIEEIQRQGYLTSMMIPMISNGQVLGTCNVSSRRANAFSPEDGRRGEAVGRWIGSQLLIRKFATEMEHLAMVDPTTGQANRRAFMSAANGEMRAFLDKGDIFSVVLFDLDHFKRVNDRYGHEAGDKVLRNGAGVIAAKLHPQSVLGRIGGEEFAVLLPNTTIGEAVPLAEDLRAALSRTPFEVGDDALHVTASFGCAAAEAGDTTIDDVLRRADKALYAAKTDGRNRIKAAA